MTAGELDLDAPPPEPRRRSAAVPVAVAAVALLLLATGVGAIVRTLVSPPPPASAPEARVSLLDTHFEGGAVATLRLSVHNGDNQPITVASLAATGVRDDRIEVPVREPVGPGETATFPVRVVPQCDGRVATEPLAATIRLADGRDVPALTARAVEPPGAICRQVTATLPRGWENAIFGAFAVASGDSLHVMVTEQVDVQKVIGVWIGDTIVSPSTPLVVADRRLQPFTITRPDACMMPAGEPVPAGIRLVTIGKDGLRDRYVPIGASLAAWLAARC